MLYPYIIPKITPINPSLQFLPIIELGLWWVKKASTKMFSMSSTASLRPNQEAGKSAEMMGMKVLSEEKRIERLYKI